MTLFNPDQETRPVADRPSAQRAAVFRYTFVAAVAGVAVTSGIFKLCCGML